METDDHSFIAFGRILSQFQFYSLEYIIQLSIVLKKFSLAFTHCRISMGPWAIRNLQQLVVSFRTLNLISLDVANVQWFGYPIFMISSDSISCNMTGVGMVLLSTVYCIDMYRYPMCMLYR